APPGHRADLAIADDPVAQASAHEHEVRPVVRTPGAVQYEIGVRVQNDPRGLHLGDGHRLDPAHRPSNNGRGLSTSIACRCSSVIPQPSVSRTRATAKSWLALSDRPASVPNSTLCGGAWVTMWRAAYSGVPHGQW